MAPSRGSYSRRHKEDLPRRDDTSSHYAACHRLRTKTSVVRAKGTAGAWNHRIPSTNTVKVDSLTLLLFLTIKRGLITVKTSWPASGQSWKADHRNAFCPDAAKNTDEKKNSVHTCETTRKRGQYTVKAIWVHSLLPGEKARLN